MSGRGGVTRLVMQQDPSTSSARGASLSGVQSTSAAASFNLAKAIVGAGSFSLPYVCKNQGIVGGLITISACAVLASYTMQSIIESKNQVEADTGREGLSYVDVAEITLGQAGSRVVFTLTALASLLVCSSYIAFIGSTLATMSAQQGNFVHELLPGVSKQAFEEGAAAVLLPITLLRSFGFLSFTSVLGIISVLSACLTVVVDGLSNQGSVDASIRALEALPLWPASITAYFQSFGSVVFLFCVNFLIFPIEANLQNKADWPVAVQRAVTATALCNFAFAALGYSFFGDQTQEIVLNNLGPGAILSAVKILLCIDLLFSYPLVIAASRDIIETAVLGANGEKEERAVPEKAAALLESPGDAIADTSLFVGPEQAAIRVGLVASTLVIAQTKGFGIITNVAGGLAQGTLAFIVPGALILKLKEAEIKGTVQEGLIKTLISFGFFSAGITTYLALVS
eukprot:Tamp_14097.p1 GENE.Tamp_14097~~Tamp_14097.p1  ORF type:complete len:510 (+),score=68.49 Tamp_14097:164-1531(+)